MWDNEAEREEITQYLLRLNLGLADIRISKKDFDETDLPKGIDERARNLLVKKLSGSQSFLIQALHKTYSLDGKETGKNHAWNFEERESKGTVKALYLSGPVLWALKNGGVLIIDEIEAKMHPILTLVTINMFLHKKTNPNNAQLTFATHDTNLLSYSELRRDQIYFTEKNNWESTEIFSLSDFVYLGETGNSKFEKERPDTDKEKRYFEGRYGAIPFLGSKPLKSKNNG